MIKYSCRVIPGQWTSSSVTKQPMHSEQSKCIAQLMMMLYFLLLTMLPFLLLFLRVLGRDLVRTCPAGQSCVAFTHCVSWCERAETGLVGRDPAVRRDLLSNTCNFVGSMPYVCCPQSAVTQEKLCSLESEIKHLQPSKDTAQQCGQVQSAQLRCVGCNSTSPGDWPYMRILTRAAWSPPVGESLCLAGM